MRKAEKLKLKQEEALQKQQEIDKKVAGVIHSVFCGMNDVNKATNLVMRPNDLKCVLNTDEKNHKKCFYVLHALLIPLFVENIEYNVILNNMTDSNIENLKYIIKLSRKHDRPDIKSVEKALAKLRADNTPEEYVAIKLLKIIKEVDENWDVVVQEMDKLTNTIDTFVRTSEPLVETPEITEQPVAEETEEIKEQKTKEDKVEKSDKGTKKRAHQTKRIKMPEPEIKQQDAKSEDLSTLVDFKGFSALVQALQDMYVEANKTCEAKEKAYNKAARDAFAETDPKKRVKLLERMTTKNNELLEAKKEFNKISEGIERGNNLLQEQKSAMEALESVNKKIEQFLKDCRKTQKK